MRLIRVLLVTILLPCLLAPESFAQDRRGFAFSLSGGYGSSRASCDGCEKSSESGSAGELALNWGMNEQVLVGAAFQVWSRQPYYTPALDATVRLDIVSFSPTLTVYPISRYGLFLRGGLGVSIVSQEVTTGGTTISDDLARGPGVVVAGGWDIKVSRRWFLTPSLQVWRAREILERDFRTTTLVTMVGVAFQ